MNTSSNDTLYQIIKDDKILIIFVVGFVGVQYFTVQFGS